MTIAQELKQRREFLTDPAVEWVPCCPRRDGPQSCLVWSGQYGWISEAAQRWLDDFVAQMYAGWPSAVDFNDRSTYREQVLWMLDEAIDQAKFEGR